MDESLNYKYADMIKGDFGENELGHLQVGSIEAPSPISNQLLRTSNYSHVDSNESCVSFKDI